MASFSPPLLTPPKKPRWGVWPPCPPCQYTTGYYLGILIVYNRRNLGTIDFKIHDDYKGFLFYFLSKYTMNLKIVNLSYIKIKDKIVN